MARIGDRIRRDPPNDARVDSIQRIVQQIDMHEFDAVPWADIQLDLWPRGLLYSGYMEAK